MASRSSDDFGISDEDIQAIAKQLEYQASEVKSAIIQTVNSAADDVVDRGIRAITKKVNLPPSYIQSHLKVSKRSSNNSDTAVVSATQRGVLLSRFDVKQEYRQSRDPRRRSGERVRGGVSVRVKSDGGRVSMASAFLIKLKGSGATGVAINPKDKAKLHKKEWREVDKHGYVVLHGPSVDQLFAATKDELAPSLDELTVNFMRKLNSV